MLTVVIDTNILIDAWKDEYSYQKRIMDLVMQGEIRVVASQKILNEGRLILDRLVNNKEHYNLVQKFFSCIKVVSVKKSVQVVKWDPEDDKFLACAVEAGADYIISSDSHLLEVGEHRGTKILNPKDFWLVWQRQNNDGGDVDALEWASWAEDLLGRK